MINLSKYFFLLFFVTISTVAVAQDVPFSQFYANPLYINPAFTGSVEIPRAVLHYRNQWHGFSNAFSTYSAAFDIPVKKLQGGIGLNILNDAQANGLLNSTQVNLSYSVFIQLTKTFDLHAGFQTGFNRNSLNAGQLIFGDNLDSYYGNHGVSQELQNLTDPNYNFIDFATGFLLFSERIFYGLAIHHLTEPNQTYYPESNSNSTLKRKYTAHFGAKLPVFTHGYNRKFFDISPNLIIQNQGIFRQVNYGIFATKQGLSLGAWFRQNFGLRYDAIILTAGFFKENWQFTYSYDWTVSGMRADSGGTNEVSLAFLIRQGEKKRNFPFFNQYEDKFGKP